MIDPPAERIVDVVLRGVGAKTPTSPLPARRLHRLKGRRGGFALPFLTNKIDRIPLERKSSRQSHAEIAVPECHIQSTSAKVKQSQNEMFFFATQGDPEFIKSLDICILSTVCS
jgi:hypothetical protein